MAKLVPNAEGGQRAPQTGDIPGKPSRLTRAIRVMLPPLLDPEWSSRPAASRQRYFMRHGNKRSPRREEGGRFAVDKREVEWADLMRAASSGDNTAYERLLRLLTPALRTFAGRAVARTRTQVDAEDIVQETLIAIHLKRHTWIETEPLGPWIRAIARHKLIDSLRRRGHRVHLPIEDLEDVLPAAQETISEYPRRDIERHLPRLPARQRDVIQAIAIHGQSIRQTAELLKMTEGAVRVALHRGVAALATIVNQGAP